MRKRKTLKIKEALHVYRSAKELRGTNLEGTEKAEVCGGALRLTSAQSTSPHPYCLQLTNPPFAFYLEHLPHPRYQISQQFYLTPSPIPAFCWNYPLLSPQCYLHTASWSPIRITWNSLIFMFNIIKPSRPLQLLSSMVQNGTTVVLKFLYTSSDLTEFL
jgi:hypothetical protein